MRRYIPGKTKVKMEFYRGVTLGDIIVMLIALAGGVLIISMNMFTDEVKYSILIAWAALLVAMFIKVDEDLRLYGSLGLLFRFAAFKKRYSSVAKKGYTEMSKLTPFLGIEQGKFINYGEYYGMVVEITPAEFYLLGEEKQNILIGAFSNALKLISNYQTASIVKVRKPMIFDEFIANDDNKYDIVNKMAESGEFTKEELEARGSVFEERVFFLQARKDAEVVLKDHFYIVVYSTDKDTLEDTCNAMVRSISSGQLTINSKIAVEKDILSFLKATYSDDVQEQELDNLPASQYLNYIMPKTVDFKILRTVIDGVAYRNMVVSDYPLQVFNAWAYQFFSLDKTKVIMNLKPVPKDKAERQIDVSLMELENKRARTAKSSSMIQIDTQIETLRALLQMLKNNNEQLFNINTHIRCEESAKKEVKSILRQSGFKVADMFGRQVDAFVSNNISRLDTIKGYERGLPTTTLAACFPFISQLKQDPNGFYFGDNEYPVFIDFFKRDRERINSNMMIIGKSGSGKSYATKTLLANLAADKTKIFILDPEKEYIKLARSVKGQIIDVGSSAGGMINPFHVMSSLTDDDDDDEYDTEGFGEEIIDFINATTKKKGDDFNIHLQFVEQFFRVVMNGMSSDAFELLNSLIIQVYKIKNIDANSDFESLDPKDYPIFDDLFKLVNERLKKEEDPYFRQNLQVLQTYVEKFSTGGRNSNLWNGPTTMSAKENFILFNFQTLFANNNAMLANAQMLLIFKFLNNEIIKNKDFNTKYKMKRQVVVTVDEAHLFIDPKFPIALSFMAEMAKRIRKYEGMQIVITQNIKDFLGSQDIQRQSSAIINASQYSLIFQLAPNDMADLLQLYSSAGGLTEEEQEGIVTADKGVGFLITGPLSRTFLKIVALPHVRVITGEA